MRLRICIFIVLFSTHIAICFGDFLGEVVPMATENVSPTQMGVGHRYVASMEESWFAGWMMKKMGLSKGEIARKLKAKDYPPEVAQSLKGDIHPSFRPALEAGEYASTVQAGARANPVGAIGQFSPEGTLIGNAYIMDGHHRACGAELAMDRIAKALKVDRKALPASQKINVMVRFVEKYADKDTLARRVSDYGWFPHGMREFSYQQRFGNVPQNLRVMIDHYNNPSRSVAGFLFFQHGVDSRFFSDYTEFMVAEALEEDPLWWQRVREIQKVPESIEDRNLASYLRNHKPGWESEERTIKAARRYIFEDNSFLYRNLQESFRRATRVRELPIAIQNRAIANLQLQVALEAHVADLYIEQAELRKRQISTPEVLKEYGERALRALEKSDKDLSELLRKFDFICNPAK